MILKNTNNLKFFLIVTTVVVGMCSIVYELLISTTASYFLGNSVQQFSLIIGIYMASMGVGAWLSRLFETRLLYRFVQIEILLGLVGALSVPLCYFYFSLSDAQGFALFTYLIITIIGILTGLEVPLLTRILEHGDSLKDNLSSILAFDYLGALLATLLFPFFLLPFVGLFKSSLFFGLINVCIGVWTYIVFRKQLEADQGRRLIWLSAGAIILLIGVMLWQSKRILSEWNDKIFKYEVVYERQSPYQNIVLTQNASETRMHLNGAIQFSSRDEYRYHEALVHIPAQQVDSVQSVLILGGGEGLALREVLKYQELQAVTVVDLDPTVVEISRQLPILTTLNQSAFEDHRVEVVAADAFTFLSSNTALFDLIIVDLPDPTSESLARLYSDVFFKMIFKALQPDGIMVTQATSPELTPDAFWCIDQTIGSLAGVTTYPYHVSIPSFGEWGFVMARRGDLLRTTFRKDISLKYLENGILHHLMYFPKDKRTVDILPNTLDQPVLLDYYLVHWQSLQGKER